MLQVHGRCTIWTLPNKIGHMKLVLSKQPSHGGADVWKPFLIDVSLSHRLKQQKTSLKDINFIGDSINFLKYCTIITLFIYMDLQKTCGD